MILSLYLEAQRHEAHLFHIEAPPQVTLTAREFPESANHSILRHSARPPEELIVISTAFNPLAVRNYIPLTPQRLVLHNLTRRFILDYSLQGELSTELVKVIEPLVHRFLEGGELLARCEEIRASVQAQAHKYLTAGETKDISPQMIESLEKLKSQIRAESGLNEEDIIKAVSMRMADLVVESYVKEQVNEFNMSVTPELAGYKRLPPQTKETRRTFMMNGGVASGKSSSQRVQIEKAMAEGVVWSDVLTINRDAFKPMLFKREEVTAGREHFFASYAEDEAFLLRDAIMQEYKERLKMDTAPHLYVDQVWPNLDMMEMAGDLSGRGLDLTIVQSPVENSFLMAHGRYLETGYAAVTAGLLNTHKGVPDKLLESLAIARRMGKSHIRLTILANVAKGVIVPVASIDFREAQGKISDMDHLLMFFRKSAINPRATRFSEVYAADTPGPEHYREKVDQLVESIRLIA